MVPEQEDLLPEGVDLVSDAVHRLREAKRRLDSATREYEAERDKLSELLAVGVCNETNRCPHADEPLQPYKPFMKMKWRIALKLLKNPVINYQETARELWGDLSPLMAKNRVNAHLQTLRKLGIVTTVGSNTFMVNRKKLAELSNLDLETLMSI